MLAGYALGENWEDVSDYVSVYSKGVLGAAVLAVLAFVTLRVARPGRGKRRG